MLNRDIIREVRAMLERHWSADAIATRLKISASDVLSVIQLKQHHIYH